MKLDRFLTFRPYAYHLTARQNIRGIRQQGALLSASQIAKRPSEKSALTARRTGSISMEAAHIRDQRPLHRGNVEFAPGFTFEQLLALLNSLVYFWPGPQVEEKGPIAYGWRHFGRYQAESPVILRTRTADLIAENAHEVLVCPYNSGSPRCSHGRKSPRGPQTFRPIADFPGAPSKVVEIAFSETARLPASTEMGDKPAGPWVSLFRV